MSYQNNDSAAVQDIENLQKEIAEVTSMTEEKNSSARGNKDFDAAVNNLEGLFTKLSKVFDIRKYKESLNAIKMIAINDPDLKNRMPSEEMQSDYENGVYAPYVRDIEVLTQEINAKYFPFYIVHLLCVEINAYLAIVGGENIHIIIRETKDLIDKINKLNTHDDKEKMALFDRAYETIYKVILYEEMFNRSDILSYINGLNIPENRENIGRLLDFDLTKLNKAELIGVGLKGVQVHGLDYDHLDPDTIRIISRMTVGEQNSEYQVKKSKVITDLNHGVSALADEKDSLLHERKANKQRIRELRVNKALLNAKVVSFVLVPVITFSAGMAIGHEISNNINEYKTITRTIDLNTGDIIGEPKITFEEKETTYVATVIVYEPWQKNPTGRGYISNAKAYEYVTPKDAGSDYHLTIDDLEGNVKAKYPFTEMKDELTASDSTTDYTIVVTETFQDKTNPQKSTKYTMPFAVFGAVLGILIDTLLVLSTVYSAADIGRKIDDLSEEIRKHKLSNKEISDRLKEMSVEAQTLKQEYDEAVKKYGYLGTKFTFGDIDSLTKKKLK